MINEILLAIIQSITEYLPISSSGHLALISNLISQPSLFFFTLLHLASLFAVLIFLRKDIKNLLFFRKESIKLWLYWIIATIPAAIFGYFFRDLIESSFNSFLFLGFAFIFTGFVLLLTKNTNGNKEINWKTALLMGFFQILALFPGISRSGITISIALLLGIKRETAVKFSFLLFIPLAIGAFILEASSFYLDFSLIISFFLCIVLSLVFLNILNIITKRGKFWLFSFYCFLIGIVCLLIYFL